MPTFVINGFYMAMKDKYTKGGAQISYFLVDWDEKACSWADFRGKVLGATDPVEAAEGSARRVIYNDWQKLGLASQPNVGDNGVHASASPFEALAERMNWVGAKLSEDPFGKALLAAGIPEATILEWTKDPQVDIGGGKKGSLFDALEDLDCSACVKRAAELAGKTATNVPTRNSAFVFVKPHAANPDVVALVKGLLTKAGISVNDGGNIDGKTIDEKLLIDTHYYAIASKASLTKPKDLNPPAAKLEEFKKLFGISWEDALKQGLVYNAQDACAKIGIDGAEMDRRWASAKKNKKLVKFGGGFYAGEVDDTPPAGGACCCPANFIFPAAVALSAVVVLALLVRRRA